MEPHEVFVPFPAETIRRSLADLERVARCVPGLQRDAGAEDGLAGRLRLRIGGSTITYRGTLRLVPRGGGLAVEGEAVEARGAGTVKLALELGVDGVSGGALLTVTGSVQADGRLADHDEATVAAAGHRLLDRFVAALTSDLEEHASAGPPEPSADSPAEPSAEGTVEDLTDDLPAQLDEFAGHDAQELQELQELPEPEDADGEGAGEVLPAGGTAAEVPEDPAGIDLPAEAAHARRTLIGRSAEEVDHAPPRGRYAPVPAPQSGAATASLRRYAPAAAALLLSAVVAGRVLRRRRRSFP
ncbi:SRPBCC domain-containing protein [Actinacidiphila glaucinigra]|uniref:SRPBCC domain-containing protein n=1 Tax=Actinacidiphila glaucinigra TaxID=235986 RepID=UPI002DD9C184|nr:SRPBCC domain-containing protein [Actinacidiphila glaucinigra]WSD61335.1 SRPBCC domain-containing protein [Actinacidiphila glaucinigra]